VHVCFSGAFVLLALKNHVVA